MAFTTRPHTAERAERQIIPIAVPYGSIPTRNKDPTGMPTGLVLAVVAFVGSVGRGVLRGTSPFAFGG